jgi:Elongation factor Tu C-terminal domain
MASPRARAIFCELLDPLRLPSERKERKTQEKERGEEGDEGIASVAAVAGRLLWNRRTDALHAANWVGEPVREEHKRDGGDWGEAVARIAVRNGDMPVLAIGGGPEKDAGMAEGNAAAQGQGLELEVAVWEPISTMNPGSPTCFWPRAVAVPVVNFNMLDMCESVEDILDALSDDAVACLWATFSSLAEHGAHVVVGLVVQKDSETARLAAACSLLRRSLDALGPSSIASVAIVPISVASSAGENISSRAEGRVGDLCGQHGLFDSSLLRAIEEATLASPDLRQEGPAVFLTQDTYKIGGIGGRILVGRVASGTLRGGQVLHFRGAGGKGESEDSDVQGRFRIESIEQHHEQIDEVGPSVDGFGIQVVLDGDDDPDSRKLQYLRRGRVLTEPDVPVGVVKSFEAELFPVNERGITIRQGYTPVIDVGTGHVACKFAELLSGDRSTTASASTPPGVSNRRLSVWRVEPTKPEMAVSVAMPALSYFRVRDMRKTVAYGRVVAVEPSRGGEVHVKSATKR